MSLYTAIASQGSGAAKLCRTSSARTPTGKNDQLSPDRRVSSLRASPLPAAAWALTISASNGRQASGGSATIPRALTPTSMSWTRTDAMSVCLRTHASRTTSRHGLQASRSCSHGTPNSRSAAVRPLADESRREPPRDAGRTPASESQATWSPDGKQIAFVCDAPAGRSDGSASSMRAATAARSSRRMTGIGGTSGPDWAPARRVVDK